MSDEITGDEARDILDEARERFHLCVDAEADNRKEALDDLRFRSGEQWDERDKKARDLANRPCLTVNRVDAVVRGVVNEYRQSRPAVDVIPGDSAASPATAEVVQGLVRYIERSSRARIAYDSAYDYEVSCGVGHWRVVTDYVDDESFNQEIRIEPIDNPFSVYRDPLHMVDHLKDRFSFVTTLVHKDDFEAEYGFEPMTLDEAGNGDDVAIWFDGTDYVRVAEYWRVNEDKSERWALSDGSVVNDAKVRDAALKAGVQVLNTRTVTTKTVESFLLTYDRVIRKTAWAGSYIPICTAYGALRNIAGRYVIESLIRHAKDVAKMYNYWATAETEAVALQPKAPWVGAKGAFDQQPEWDNANVINYSKLEYNPVQNEPPPQRQSPPMMPQGIREGRMAAAEDLKAVFGIYDASLGARSNEVSGVAIRAREEQGDTGTYHFVANHAQAVEACGTIIVDLIPHVYDKARVIQIVSPQNDAQMMAINQVFIDPVTQQETLHNLSVGKYDVAVRVGPSFESKRQELTNSLVELYHGNPALMQATGDLFFKNLDFPFADEIAQRLQRMLPPAAMGQPTPPPPEIALIQAQTEVEKIKGETTKAKSAADVQIKQMEAQVAAQELAIKQAELELAKVELAIKAGEVGNVAELDKMKLMVEREKTGVEAMKAQNERMAQQMQTMQMQTSPIVGADGQPMASGTMQMPDMSRMNGEHQQMMQNMTALIVEIGQLARIIAAPKETTLITGANGKPVGSRTEIAAPQRTLQ